MYFGPDLEWHLRKWTKHMLTSRGRANHVAKALPRRVKWRGRNRVQANRGWFGPMSFKDRKKCLYWGYRMRLPLSKEGKE